jgi:hypothetical protein
MFVAPALISHFAAGLHLQIPSQLFRHPESLKLFHRRDLMLFGRVRVAQDHLDSRMA